MIKLVAEMSLQELAAYVATHLRSRQLPVVLVGEGMLAKFETFLDKLSSQQTK
jgi:hypothetical protein